MKQKSTEWFIAIMLTIMGAIFFIIGLMVIKNEMSFKSKSIETVAEITDIETYRSRDNTDHIVYIKYIVNNKVYNEVLNYWNSGMSVGEEVNILYNPDNPNEMTAKNSSYFAFIFPVIGGITFIIGILILINKIKRKNMKSELLKNGDYITAEIEEIIYNTSYTVNGRHPYIITCRWENPADGNTYLFKSENIWYNPASIIEERNITTFPVYINRNNLKKYFMSLENIEDNVIDLR